MGVGRSWCCLAARTYRCDTMNVSIQSWCRRWQIRSAIEGASAGTWKRLRKALLNPSSTGAGRAQIVACSWRMVA